MYMASPDKTYTDPQIRSVGEEAMSELNSAINAHRAMASGHEGWAVILEEVEELWDLVKLNPRKMSPSEKAVWEKKMRSEALQVAAMGMRYVLDVCDDKP